MSNPFNSLQQAKNFEKVAREETEKLLSLASHENVAFPVSWDEMKIRVAIAACLSQHKKEHEKKKTHGHSLASHSAYDSNGALQHLIDQFGKKKPKSTHKKERGVYTEEKEEGIDTEEAGNGGKEQEAEKESHVVAVEANQGLYHSIREMAEYLEYFLYEPGKAEVFYRDAELIRHSSHWLANYKDALKEGLTKEICSIVDEYNQTGGTIAKLEEWKAEFSE